MTSILSKIWFALPLTPIYSNILFDKITWATSKPRETLTYHLLNLQDRLITARRSLLQKFTTCYTSLDGYIYIWIYIYIWKDMNMCTHQTYHIYIYIILIHDILVWYMWSFPCLSHPKEPTGDSPWNQAFQRITMRPRILVNVRDSGGSAGTWGFQAQHVEGHWYL